MREVKFKAFVKEIGKIFDVTELYGDGGVMVCNYDFPLNAKDIELMQYTGLKDKNGVDIYIGDLLNKNSHGWVVADYFEFGSVKMNRIGGKGLSSNPRLTKFQAETSIVVGNIYENPELLKTPN